MICPATIFEASTSLLVAQSLAKINPNTPIAKGNKLVKKLVPENRLAE